MTGLLREFNSKKRMHWSGDPSPPGNAFSLQINTQILNLVNLSSLMNNSLLLVC